MTDLVTRLLALADEHKHWEQRLVATLREAADTFVSVFKAWEEERNALKSKLADAEKQHDGWIKIANNSMLRAEKAEARVIEVEDELGKWHERAHALEEKP